MTKHHKVLFACSEITPLLKTGGLADVSASLPDALQKAGTDVTIILPGYKAVLQQLTDISFVTMLDLPLAPVALCRSQYNDKDLLFICHPAFSNRDGNPYMSDNDRSWPDNPMRFALFSQAVAELGLNHQHLNWQPDIVHCNDWQTGLVPALLALNKARPATVFTIHNLAYQGNISKSAYNDLNLAAALFHPNGLEFWGGASYIKGGIAYADRVNTVSPTYAREIQTDAFGNGMDGLLRSRSTRVSGILNGIDNQQWNPQTDSFLACNYNVTTVTAGKEINKKALQKKMGLALNPNLPVFGVVSRLAGQKGIDVIVDALESLPSLPFQLALLGAGESILEDKLKTLQKKYPQQVAIKIGFDESLSRLIEAGADIFLMPSRYEPCGLNQLYSLRYGTLPLVTDVGGLADTVINYNNNPQHANGFTMSTATSAELRAGIERALSLYQNKPIWQQLQRNGMTASYGWDKSADLYQCLYDRAIKDATSANETTTSAPHKQSG